MDDETTADEQAYSSGDEVGRDHIPTVNLRQSWWKPLTEDRPATPEPAWTIPSSDLATNFSQIKVDDANPRYNVSKPPSTEGEPGHVNHYNPDFFFNKDLEYLRLCRRQRFYIDRFSSEGDRRAVRTHMRILSVVRIEVFSMYGYNYMKKIVLRRADLKEYVIAERDFKHMYPSDFEDLYLLNLQGHLNHLSPEDKKILTTAVNLWTRNLVIRHRVEDFQLETLDLPERI
ncbi:hypothetical protein Tco_1254047 [Tanacetum coccineum]